MVYLAFQASFHWRLGLAPRAEEETLQMKHLVYNSTLHYSFTNDQNIRV